MTKQDELQKCPIQDHIKLICPLCCGLVEVPMCQAVNGEKIICPNCHNEFLFQALYQLKTES